MGQSIMDETFGICEGSAIKQKASYFIRVFLTMHMVSNKYGWELQKTISFGKKLVYT